MGEAFGQHCEKWKIETVKKNGETPQSKERAESGSRTFGEKREHWREEVWQEEDELGAD